MSGHSIALATGGIIFCRKPIIRKTIYPFTAQLHAKNVLDVALKPKNLLQTSLQDLKLNVNLVKNKINVGILEKNKLNFSIKIKD